MMTFIAPVMTIYFGYIVPAALSIYWTASSVFGVAQDIWLGKRYSRIIEAENAAKNELKRAKEAELEAKRVETERKKAENATTVNPNTSKRRLQTTEKQEQKQKATQWERTNNPREREDEPGRVDSRRYARGRAYDPNRFDETGEAAGETESVTETETDDAGGVGEVPEIDGEGAPEGADTAADAGADTDDDADADS
jgi:YidC/Oxa1 family membrane protein insertase